MSKSQLGKYNKSGKNTCQRCGTIFLLNQKYVRNNSGQVGAKLYCIECAKELNII